MADPVTDDLNLDDVFKPDAPVSEAKPETAEPVDTRPRDEHGRFATKQEQPATEAEAAQPKPEEQSEAAPRHVPLKELQSERQKRQEEARLRTEAETRVAAYERQIAQMLQQQQQHEAPQQPDWYAEPDRAAHSLQQQVNYQLTQTKVAMSQEFMRSQHKDYQELEQVFTDAANRNPQMWQQLYAHPMPAQYAYQQGKRIKAMQDIGEDPDAYRARIKEEATQQVLADLKGGKIKLNGQPVPTTRFPGTLADQTSAGVTQTAQITDDAMMADVFARRR